MVGVVSKGLPAEAPLFLLRGYCPCVLVGRPADPSLRSPSVNAGAMMAFIGMDIGGTIVWAIEQEGSLGVQSRSVTTRHAWNRESP